MTAVILSIKIFSHVTFDRKPEAGQFGRGPQIQVDPDVWYVDAGQILTSAGSADWITRMRVDRVGSNPAFRIYS